MSDRIFELLVNSEYQDPDNTPRDMAVKVRRDGEWEPFDLTPYTPGFLIFVYGLFACQHTYVRLNCAERKIKLAAAEGYIRVVTTQDWDIRETSVHFGLKLAEGRLCDDDREYIIGRMEQCPSTRNIVEPPHKSTELEVVA